MKKIYVVNKTHFDVGFTDLAENIFKRYIDEYIPNAITLAEELSKTGEHFTWTTGSFLIKYFLMNKDDESVMRLGDAIKKGYIRWHGIPLTFHTELLSQELADYMFSISKSLDMEFDTITTSSKMTDVPGHTKGLIKYMHKNGIKFIHIGVNGVSSIPDVPEMFLWRDGASEVIVSYSNDYGGMIEAPFLEEKMTFMHTHDNSGPGTIEKVTKFMQETREKYPDYEVTSTSMDEFSNILWEKRHLLPVVEDEIGDTWIHGVASDPELIRVYKTLTEYLKTNKVSDKAMMNALLIPEHTWGMDIKRYFSDYTNYTKADFVKARKIDNITDSDLTDSYMHVRDNTLGEMQFTNFEWTDRSYKLYESSWKEKRNNINNVYAELDSNIVKSLNLKNEIPKFEIKNENIEVGQEIKINGYKIIVDTTGALSLVQKNNITYFNENNKCGELNYSVCGMDDYDHLRNNYLRDTSWWHIDFLKPGMELQTPVQMHQNNKPFVKKIELDGNKLYISVMFSVNLSNNYGAPREIMYCYTFDNTITFEATLKNKDAIRLAEIISFNFNLDISCNSKLLMEKLGTMVSPLEVVKKGNRMQHIVENINYKASDKEIIIKPITSPLCSFGTYNNLLYKHDYDAKVNDLYFVLLNTTWGTNFTMWYEEDIYAKFELTLK